MKGVIYRVRVDHRNIDEHPHVVVVAVGRQCFVIPAYSPSKPKVTQAIEALAAMGYSPEKVIVELDNAEHVQPLTSFPWHRSWWFIWQGYWRSKDDFELVTPEGIMDDAGMRAIAQGVLALAAEKPELFSVKQLELVSRWLTT